MNLFLRKNLIKLQTIKNFELVKDKCLIICLEAAHNYDFNDEGDVSEEI